MSITLMDQLAFVFLMFLLPIITIILVAEHMGLTTAFIEQIGTCLST